MRKYARWPRGRQPILSPTVLPVAEQSSRAGAVTGVGVTGSRVLASARGCFVAAAAMRSALLLPLAAGVERKLERRPRRSLTWSVVHIVEVVVSDGAALMTGSAAGGLGIQPPGRRLTYRRCRATRSLGVRRWAKLGLRRSTTEPLEPSAL
jgi:hypothetical protein